MKKHTLFVVVLSNFKLKIDMIETESKELYSYRNVFFKPVRLIIISTGKCSYYSYNTTSNLS